MAALPTQFQPGQSGNKRGRPKGALNKVTLVSKELAQEGSAIARVVMDAALAGDMTAATFLLSRIVPAVKARSQPVQFEFDTTLPLVEQARQVLSAVANGVLDSDTGKQLIDIIASFSKLREVDEMAARLTELERVMFDSSIRREFDMERIAIEEDTKS